MLLFARIGGILIILLGIHQLGIIKFKTLEKTFKIGMKPKKTMNIFVAFAWDLRLVSHGHLVLVLPYPAF